MLKPEKVTAVEEIKENLGSAKIAILTGFQGMTVAEMNELRKQFREADIGYKVYKNTMLKLAAKDLGLSGVDKYLFGTTALAFSKGDLSTPAKIVKDFSAKHQHFMVKAGIIENRVVDSKGVIELASLPPREILVAMVLRGIQAPISRFLSVLQGPISNLVVVLKGLAEKKEKAEGTLTTPDQQTEENQENQENQGSESQ